MRKVQQREEDFAPIGAKSEERPALFLARIYQFRGVDDELHSGRVRDMLREARRARSDTDTAARAIAIARPAIAFSAKRRELMDCAQRYRRHFRPQGR